MPTVPAVGYYPYAETERSLEAEWLAEHLPVTVRVATGAPCLSDQLPRGRQQRERLDRALAQLRPLPAVVAEGPGGFLLAALLRSGGFAGAVTILPYLNPRRWYDVAAVALYRRFADPRDRIFLGSGRSAAVYRGLGVPATVGEPYGIDDQLFTPEPPVTAGRRRELSIPPGRMLLYAGRAQPDKDLYRLLRVAVKARVLFPDLQFVVASHVLDESYLAAAHAQLGPGDGVHFVTPATRERLAELYRLADLAVTASTSQFETFGRAMAEALACGTPAVAPRYDGFVELLAQPGGTLVDVEINHRTGAPEVSEQRLLRAVYEVLSAPAPPDCRQVAAAARRRFGRSGTIGLLSYLAQDPVPPRPPEPPDEQPAVPLDLPDDWLPALAELAGRDPTAALAWFWDGCDHDRLTGADAGFATRVRRALCAPVPEQPRPEVAACR